MDRRTFKEFLILATVLFGVWFLVGRVLFPPPERTTESHPDAVVTENELPGAPADTGLVSSDTSLLPADTSLLPPDTSLAPAPPQGAAPPATRTVGNDRIQAVWTNRGAAVESLQLRDWRTDRPWLKAPYRDEDGKRPILTLLRAFEGDLLSDAIESVTFLDPEGRAEPVTVPADGLNYYIPEDTAAGAVLDELVFTSPVIDGGAGRLLRIVKTVRAAPGNYHFDVTVELRNESPGRAYNVSLALRGAAGIEREELMTRHTGTRIGVATGPDEYKIADVGNGELDKKERKDEDYPVRNKSVGIAWAAVVNHYFAAVLDPVGEKSWIGQAESRLIVDDDVLSAGKTGRWKFGSIPKEGDRPGLARKNAAIVVRSVPLVPGGEPIAYRFIAVPRALTLLRPYGEGMDGLVEFGWFGGISRIVLWILNGIERVLRNYGVAILLLTALVRAVLHPLTRKSQVGMIKMQKLQPQIKELQKKFAGDRQKLSQEQMALFKKFGVSPLGGCMPMLLQLPIFIALFRALRQAFVLRQAGFLYIDDLSRPDAAFALPFFLPLLGNEINVLPVIMCILMFLQQKLMQKPAATEQERQQQSMMKWMPLIFGFILYKMPSGLCLYWTTSTAIGIVERWLIERKSKEIELKPVEVTVASARRPPGPAARPGAKPKTGWLAKLQNYVDEQNKAAARRDAGKGKRNNNRKK